MQTLFNILPCLGLTFPYDDNLPTKLFELKNISSIPFPVCLKFFGPEIDIAFWQMFSVFAVMPVPETAVDENASSMFGHDNIGFTRQVATVQSESESLIVKVFSDSDFGLGVLWSDTRHHSASYVLADYIHRSNCSKKIQKKNFYGP